MPSHPLAVWQHLDLAHSILIIPLVVLLLACSVKRKGLPDLSHMSSRSNY